jgi:hypothetical protein
MEDPLLPRSQRRRSSSCFTRLLFLAFYWSLAAIEITAGYLALSDENCNVDLSVGSFIIACGILLAIIGLFLERSYVTQSLTLKSLVIVFAIITSATSLVTLTYTNEAMIQCGPFALTSIILSAIFGIIALTIGIASAIYSNQPI